MPGDTLAIEADGLSKRYRTGRGTPPVEALRGLSFGVPRGSVFGLLGPNGAGKSTTTKILTTLALPDSGTARLGGRELVREAAAVRRLIGYVSQGTGTDPRLTASENLVLSARLRGASTADARERARALLAEFRLTDAADRPARKLSGGMRRRLDVAAALAHRPEILFLDEPTTGLDPESRAAMWGEIRRLSTEDSLTVVLTTHYLDEADRLADELMIIDRGTRIVGGSPAELKAALRGETLRVELFEPDADAVRAALAGIASLESLVVEVRGTSGALVARVSAASAALPGVIAALTTARVPFGAASVSGPTLDDVYLHHLGRSFTADESTPASEGAAA